MTIRKKSFLLIIAFVAILIVNAITMIISSNNVSEKNHELLLQTEINTDFSNLKYVLKELQELSTDISLMGEREGLEEIKKLKLEYINAIKKMKEINLPSDDIALIDLINKDFESYYQALFGMAEAGVQRTEARNLSKKIMQEFDSSVEKVEKDIQKLETLPKIIQLDIMYQIVSTQEILTDALAMGDKEGIDESKNMQNKLNNYFDEIIVNFPDLTNNIITLKKNYNNLAKQGQLMAQQGVIYEKMLSKTELQMEKVDLIADKLEKVITDITINETKDLEAIISQTNDVVSNLKNLSIVLIFLFFIGVVFLGITLKKITSNLDQFRTGLLEFFKYLNKESADVSLLISNSKDEIGEMTQVINQNITKTKIIIEGDLKFINEVKVMIEEVNKGYLFKRFENPVASENLEELRHGFNQMLESLNKNVAGSTGKVLDVLVSFGKLDFTNEIKDDEGKISLAINEVNELITEMLIENKSNGLTLRASSHTLLNNVDILTKNSNETAASLEETAAALEEITGNIRGNTSTVTQMATNANELSNSSKKGQDLASQTTQSMVQINEQVTSINDAIGIIDQIAFQTNILSLNAAVEAATAGEAGKGFAVVAQEVRNLASRSAEAAKEIKDIVEKATVKASEGRQIADSMIHGYTDLNENISKTLDLINDVDSASKEQLVAIEQINDAVNLLDRQTQENVSVAEVTQDVAKQTDKIATLIVQNADEKEFLGKETVKAKEMEHHSLENKHKKTKETSKISKSQDKTPISSPQKIKTKIISSNSTDDEWESF